MEDSARRGAGWVGDARRSHEVGVSIYHMLLIRGIRIVIFLMVLVTLAGCSTQQREASSFLGTCRKESGSVSKKEIAALFDRWNQALGTGDPRRVVALYAEKSILIPTLSNKPRLTPAEKEDCFRHFLEKRPFARIDMHEIDVGADMAVDSGLYTFTFAKTGEVVRARYSFTYRRDGSEWLIVSHHSSVMPE